jgi:predicted GNAT family acetyltransferase
MDDGIPSIGNDGCMADVVDVPERSRFEIHLDGELIGVMTYRLVGDVVVALHAEIEPGRRGHGYGGMLVARALERIRAAARYVDPRCPFVVAFIERAPEYRDLVKEI